MRNRSQAGSSATWVIMFMLMSILFVSALAFGIWAFSQRNDYKDNSDKKVAAAVTAAEATQQTKLESSFAEQQKSPYQTYQGDETFGSIKFSYPKTWSAYVDDNTNSSQPIDGYFYPQVVPGISSKTAFALRLQVVQETYDQVLQQYQGQITIGKLQAVAYTPPTLASNSAVQPGIKLTGAISPTADGTMVLMKLRDKTIKIWTESQDYNADFNNTVLATLTFSP